MKKQRPKSEWILSGQRSLWLKWGCAQYLFCHFIIAIMIDAVAELAREGVLYELMFADLLLGSEIIMGSGIH